ncbi:MAG: hypothetical protein QM500_17485 [Methylococcales bacterium]
MVDSSNLNKAGMPKIRIHPEAHRDTPDHVYTVERGDEYRSVFPEPLADCGYEHYTEAGAWEWIVIVRNSNPLAHQWAIEDAKRCAGLLWQQSLINVDFNEAYEIESDWLIFKKGTGRDEIWNWFESEFDLPLIELFAMKIKPLEDVSLC